MQKFKLYFIDTKYIDYLRKYDDKVAYNKSPNRPYIGIVYNYNGFNYFAPLSSPKPKHINLKNKAIDIFKIKNGKLGIVNINNMIPAPQKVLMEAIPFVKDQAYKNLLIDQIDYINHNRELLYNKITQFQKLYRNGHLPTYLLDRCCDFKLLEEKSKEYQPKYSLLEKAPRINKEKEYER